MATGGRYMTRDPQIAIAVEKLGALADAGTRSKTSKVRDLLPIIESLKEGGHTNEQILMVLREAKLTMSLKTFESILHRLRRARNKNLEAEKTAQGNSSVRSTQGVVTPQSEPAKRRPGNPSDLRSLRSHSAEKASEIVYKENL
jgi:hypothetical protein